jgi:hypothetical protein
MIKIYRKTLFVFIFGLVLFSANFCFAANLLQVPNPPAAGVNTPLPIYLKWAFDVGMALGFLSVLVSLMIGGVFYVLSPVSTAMRSKSREWISGAVTGFIILILLYLIITAIYPALANFGIGGGKFTVTPAQPSSTNRPHGVYFYEGNNCAANAKPATGNIPNFANFSTNPLGSVSIVQNDREKVYYISIIYTRPGYYGKCQYINPNANCDSINLTSVGSASVYRYSRKPQGTVTFYRHAAGGGKSFDREGGYLTIPAARIGEIYFKNLKELSFTGDHLESPNVDDCTVPKDEQDCKKYDKKGNCTERKCPTLAGKNISAIQISGNFLVVLEYFGQNVQGGTIADFCQAYPKEGEINEVGPKQIKWDHINLDSDILSINGGQQNNRVEFHPNYVLIIPIEKIR